MQSESKDTSNHNLWQDTPFRCIAKIGAAVVAIVFSLTMFSEGLWFKFCFSTECLAFTEGMLSLHFKVASVWLVLLGIYAAVFRSIQTATQICISSRQVAATESQNRFTNYYTHRKMFFEHLEHIEQSCEVGFRDKSHVYKLCFPKSNSKNGVREEGECFADIYLSSIEKIGDQNDTVKMCNSLATLAGGFSAVLKLDLDGLVKSLDGLILPPKLEDGFSGEGVKTESLRRSNEVYKLSHALLCVIRDIFQFKTDHQVDVMSQLRALNTFDQLRHKTFDN